MSEEKHENTEKLDCTVTVNDGAHMTCDMIEDESSEKEEKQHNQEGPKKTSVTIISKPKMPVP